MEQEDRPRYGDNKRSPLLKLVPPSVKTILDVGCDKGAFGAALKESADREVWGLEPDANSAEIAKDRLDHVIVDKFHDDNPIPDNYFDLITFNDSLEHMIEPAEALRICKTKLNTNGKVQCCVPNVRYIGNLEHLIFDKDWRYEDKGIRDRTHLRFFTKSSIERLFKEQGYSVQKTIGINPRWTSHNRIRRRILFELFPKFTQDMRYFQFVVIAETKR